MTFENNPEYQEVFTLTTGEKKIKFYTPTNMAEGYHLSRFVAAQAQSIYASSGITPQILNQIADQILLLCNDTKKNINTIRTDIGVLANQLKYRTKYPVDEYCAIRMAAIYTFVEGEDPDKVNDAWTKHKVNLAMDNPDLYAFFLDMGIRYTPRYQELLKALSEEGYSLTMREETVKSLTPVL